MKRRYDNLVVIPPFLYKQIESFKCWVDSQSGYICGVEEMVHQLIECCAGWNCANHDDLETTIWVYTLSSLLLWTNLFELWAALSWDSVGKTGDASHFLERMIII